MLTQIKKVKDNVQQMVDKGVASVEEIHKSIAEIPFAQIEKAAPERFKQYVEPVKNIQDTAIGTVYSVIRKINRQIGEMADEVLTKVGEISGKGVKDTQKTPSA